MPNQSALPQGRAAIEAWWEAFPSVTELSNSPVEIEGRGDMAYVRGRYEATLMPEGATEPIKDTGKYVDVRRKQPDGSWLVILDIWNSDLPLAEEESES